MTDDRGLEQLAQLANLLDSTGIPWWVSSGTLLDLTRDGRLQPDRDIDIECRAQGEGWAELQRRLASTGYRIRAHPYRGMLYKLWLTHPHWERPVDIDIVRDSHGTSWYPVKAAPNDLLVARLLRRVWRSTSVLDGPVGLRLLGALGFRLDHVAVPSRLLADVVRRTINGVSVPVPARTDDVLRLHYGDWRIPVDDWDFSRDDGSYIRARPEVDPSPPFLRGRSL